MRIDLRTRLRLLGLAALLVLPALVSTARPAWALQIRDTYYYSDGTYTTIVGECYDNPCTGESWCDGQITAYRQTTSERCIPQV